MKVLIINDPPYGTEKAYNALRVANQLGKDYKDEIEVRIFLMADAATCALAGQETPDGYYKTHAQAFRFKGRKRSVVHVHRPGE